MKVNEEVKLAYVYYTNVSKSASVKNMFKTCESLDKSDFIEVDVLSTLTSISELYSLFGIDKEFDYKRCGFGNKTSFVSEFLDRLLFSFISFIHLWKEDYDLIYTRDIFFLIFYQILTFSGNSKIVYECHNPYSLISIIPEYLENYGLKAADRIFCVSEGLEDNMRNRALDDEIISIQRNCVNPEEYETLDKEDEVNTVIYLGSFKPRKGVEQLLKAFSILDRRDSKLVLAGPQPNEEVKQYVDDFDRIEYLGFLSQEEIRNWLSKADVAVHTSEDCEYQRRYTCPMKLIDYMASQTPVVACDLPTSKWVGGPSFFYYKTGHPDDLAKKLNYVIENKLEAEKKTEIAYQMVLESYNYQVKRSRVEDFIREEGGLPN